MNSLCEQIELDSQLRDLKKWFKHFQPSHFDRCNDKWQILSR